MVSAAVYRPKTECLGFTHLESSHAVLEGFAELGRCWWYFEEQKVCFETKNTQNCHPGGDEQRRMAPAPQFWGENPGIGE